MARSFVGWRPTSAPRHFASDAAPAAASHRRTRDRRSTAELLSCCTPPVASVVRRSLFALVPGMIRRSVHIGALVFATLHASMLCAAQEAPPPVRPIAEALATEGSNALVTVAGRATVGSGQLQ